jgi:hypothetical protein
LLDLKEGKKTPREGFLTHTPDSDFSLQRGVLKKSPASVKKEI